MSDFPASARFVRSIALVLTATLVVGVAPRLAADTIDKYGNRHTDLNTLMDTQQRSYEQFQRDKANFENMMKRGSGPAAESSLEAWARELKEKEAAKGEAVRQAAAYRAQRNAEEAARAEAWRELDDERKARAEFEWRWEQVRFEGDSMPQKDASERMTARIGEALQGLRWGWRYALPAKADRLAEAFIRGVAYRKDFAELGVTCTEGERFAVAKELYRQSPVTVLSHEIDIMGATIAGRGRFFVEAYLAQCADQTNPANGPAESWRYGYDQGWVALACALATTDGKLDAEQRHLAASLLAQAIRDLPADPSPSLYGKSTAALMVAAAQQAPELAQSPRIQQTYIPLVKASIWSHAFTSYPVPTAGDAPLVTSPLTEMLWCGLATRLVLADASAYPGVWFAQIRTARRTARSDPVSAAAKQTLQRALDSWFTRAKASPWLRQALQADFDLACAPPEKALPQKDPGNHVLSHQEYWDWTIRGNSAERLQRDPLKQLENPNAFHSGAAGFLLHAGPATMERFIDQTCTVRERGLNGYALWNAIHLLTNFRLADGEKLPDLGISLNHWRTLVITGEKPRLEYTFNWFDSHQEPQAPVSSKDRLHQIRRDILGESAAELTLPEYSRDPAKLHESLLKLTEPTSLSDDEKQMTTELRAALRGLLTHVEEVVDPATVLTIAGIRGPMLEEWAQLGTWLDDPRRRPRDKTSPLYFPYLISTIARDQASGYWSQKSFDAEERPTNETEQRMHRAIESLISELSEPVEAEKDAAAQLRFRAVMKGLEQLGANPGLRPFLAPILVGASSRIYAAVETYHQAQGTVREFENSLKPYPETYPVVSMTALVLTWKEVAPKLRLQAGFLFINCPNPGMGSDELLESTDALVTGDTDPLADPVAEIASRTYGQSEEEVALRRRALLRATKSPRGALAYASPWESIPDFAVDHPSPPPAATLAAIAAFEKAPVGSGERARLVNVLATLQRQADLDDPLERSADKALYAAASSATDDGVAALAYATLIRREHQEIAWAYPPPARLAPKPKGVFGFSFQVKETFERLRLREAAAFASVVTAYRKNAPGARDRLLGLYDPALSESTRFALGADGGEFALLGTRARLAALGTKDAAAWLQRVTALPATVDPAGLAAAFVAATRAHPHPEIITAELLRLLRSTTEGDPVRLAVHTLLTDPEAPRFFGPAWRDESLSPFKTEWLLEILDQKFAQEIPVPEDDFSRPREVELKAINATRIEVDHPTDPSRKMQLVPDEALASRFYVIEEELGNHRIAYREQAIRERMRGLSPKTALLLAFSSQHTTSELARTLIQDAPSGFIETLAKLAVEQDPSLKPLHRRLTDGAAGRKPITAEHWALLAEGKLWPLPAGVIEAN